MRKSACATIITTSAIGLIGGSALAADLTGAELKALLSGKTVYLQTTGASAAAQPGQGIIYFAEDGTALYKIPSGAIWHGTWQIKGNTNCTEWKEKPNTGCLRYDKTGDTVTGLDSVSGQLRVTITKTAAGNAEKLTP